MDLLLKWNGQSFIPLKVDERVERWLSKLSCSQELPSTITQPRNVKFHNKLFGMLAIGFDIWPGPDEVEFRGKLIQPDKDFEKFREWITVMAGFYHFVGYPDGSYKAVADSISFASMDEEKFEAVYNKVMNVILGKIIPLAPENLRSNYADMIIQFD